MALSNDETGATSALRLRSVRGLWDPAYVDESWVGQPVMLIPRLKQIIAAHCPGLKLALTEYNWGNDDGLSSALAQVEVLGVMGREGVDLATRWVAPAAGSLVEDAFRLFLDYDRAGSRVTGDSVRATSSLPDAVQSFAERAADDTLYVVLVNQATGARSVSVAAGLPNGPASVFGFDGSSRLARMADVAASGGSVTLDMPARSARLVVSRVGCAPPAGPATDLRVRRDRAAGTILFTWVDPPGSADGVVRSDLAPGGAFTTLVGASAPGVELAVPLPPEALVFYLAAGRNACGEGPVR